MSKNNYLWVDKYRPAKLEDYVWSDDSQRSQVTNWVQEKHIPNILLSGSPGTGKTTLARCLFNELKVDETDIRYVNGSHTNGVDDIRELTRFIETIPIGEFRYVLLDEADFLSPNAQAALRNMIEEYSAICRWVLTCNYPNKIIPALHSRTQNIHIANLDRESFIARVAEILLAENIDLNGENFDILEDYVTATYPDLRKCTNLLQQNCFNGQLNRPKKSDSNNTSDYMITAIDMFKNGRIHEGRKIICANIRPEDYEDMYKMFYKNLNWWSKEDQGQNSAIVIIANRLRDHALCADSEMNLAACLVELATISQ